MAKLWLDSNVFMQAKNDYYAFDIVPGFWDVLQHGAGNGSLCCPMMVYEEIARGGDELKMWACQPKSFELFAEADENVQKEFSKVAEFVQMGPYHPSQVALFLRGADPWVISFALASGGTVVTQEKLVGADSKKIKIPNICKHFSVEYISSYEMLRRLGKKLCFGGQTV